MHFPNNIFAVTLILGGLVTFAVSWMIFKKAGGAVRWFGFMMVTIAIWATSYGCELSTDNLSEMLRWINIEYIGISFLPPLWIVFVIGFTGKENWLNPLTRILIFIIPVITQIMVWTNPLHHLYYQSVSVDSSGPFPLLDIDPAIWYRIHTVYFYAMLATGLILIITRFKKADGFIKRQNKIILFGALIPWIVNFTYLLNLRPFGHIDLTPFAFILSSLIIAVGLLRFKLFDIVPIARGKIIEALQEGIMVLDTQNRIIDLNPEMKKIIGIRGRDIIGKTPADLFPNSAELQNAIMQDPENSRIEIKLNNEHFFSITLTSLFERQTIYSGKIMLFRDITERKQNESKLQELNKLKDRLFSIISHDLRAPLVSLTDILSMANDGILTGEEFKDFLPDLSKNIGYTTSLVENLLHWSKSQLEGTVINAVPFDVKNKVNYISNTYNHLASSKGILLHNEIKEPIMAYGDKDMIQAVLRNLISNAIKFCDEGDTVSISAERDGDMVCIAVKDTGVGIAPQNIDKLFGNNNFTTRGTTNEQGTGLGLLLCKDFVEKNGGTLSVESKPGEGSRFYFTVPVDKGV